MKTIKQLTRDPNQLLDAAKSQMRSENEEDRLKRERVMDRLWQRMTEIYGHKLISQFGETIPESWERLLTEISPEQIKTGLESLVARDSIWPPDAIEFRALCLGRDLRNVDDHGNDAEWQQRRIEMSSKELWADVAEMRIRLEDTAAQERAIEAGKKALEEMKGLF